MRIVKKTFVATICAVMMILGGAVVQVPIGATQSTPGLDLSTREAVDSYLVSQGIDPAQAVFQEGLLNYAGSVCPGSEWNCVGTDRPVVQSAPGGGVNLFECPLSETSCVVVQRPSSGQALAVAGLFTGVAAAGNAGPNNIAHCVENPSNKSSTQVCVITQENSAPGKNTAKATMILIQNESGATVSIKGTQNLLITQDCDGCPNDADVKMKVQQKITSNASGPISQTAEALQSAKIDQTGGSNAAMVDQSQSQSESATGGAAILQCENALEAPCVSTQPGDQNILLDLTQNSPASSGDATQTLLQSEDGSTPDPNVVTQKQGGALEIVLDQPEGGTFNYKQSESQTVNANSMADQDQEGQVKCCLPIELTPDFITGNQSKVQSATGDPDPEQMITEIFHATCEVNCSNDQTATQNGETTTNHTSGSGTQTGVLVCTDGSCSKSSTSDPGTERTFNVYDETQDGLQTGDPVIGTVNATVNPNGEERLIIDVTIAGAAPNCTLTPQLLKMNTPIGNGGLDEEGHDQNAGAIIFNGEGEQQTTNEAGSATFHLDFAPSGDGVTDTQRWGHLDFEDGSPTGGAGNCMEADTTIVVDNEYGAAPDPALNMPFSWLE